MRCGYMLSIDGIAIIRIAQGVPMSRGLRVLVPASILMVSVALAAVLIWLQEVHGTALVLGLMLLVLGAAGTTLGLAAGNDFLRRHFGEPGADPMRQLRRSSWGAMLLGAVLLGLHYVDRWVQAGQAKIQFDTAYNRGASATKAGQWQAAVDAFSEAIGLAPALPADAARAYAWRGNARSQLKDYSQAIADFSEAIRLDPSAMAYRGRGRAYFHQGEHDRAVADFNEVIRLEPNEATGPYIRGLAYLKTKDFDRALADFGEAIRLKPSYKEAYLARSSAYAKKGDDARATADRQKAHELDPSLEKSRAEEEPRVSPKDLPAFNYPINYKVDPYIAAAAKIQSVGEDEAGKHLLALAKDVDHGDKVIILCRMLFTAKSNAEFRRPFIGAAFFLGDTAYADWPLEPIELVDGVPFLVVRGYALGGSPEHPKRYVEYCVGNCAWQTAEFKPRSAAEKQKTLEKLLASPKWKAGLTDEEKQFLTSQIK